MAKYSMVTITVDSRKTARLVAGALLKNRLAACVNEIDGVRSSYWWKGKLEKAREILLVAKTRRSLASRIIKEVKKVHPYEVPEIIFFDITNGSADYLNWIGKETGK